MEEYADIYYVDARNAVNDHRRPSGGSVRPGFPAQPWQPSRAVVVTPPPSRVAGYGGPAQVIYPQPVATVAPMPYPQPSGLSAVLGRLTTGQLVEIVAQVFAALQPLPAAPTATDSMSDNIENLVLYNSALASHAKRDEQLRTVGNIIAKLV